MSLFTDDLAAIFADTALTVPVVVAGVTYRGFPHHHEAPVQDLAGGMILASERFVRMRAVDAAAIVNGTAMTVNGISATARQIRKISTGDLVEVVYV